MGARVNKSRRQGRVAGFPRLLGERLCLDFTNTVERRLSNTPQDFLATPKDLPRWAVHASAVDQPAADRLLTRMSADHAAADAALRQALALREHTYAMLHAVATHQPAERTLATLSADLNATLGRATLRPATRGFAWHPADTVHLVTDLVALDLHQLLTTADITRVKQCPGCADCGWLFYDTSRNATRQWCSTEGCGSRAKMRRHYQRHARPQ
jgi:predicted RNA-binding Zn ribbon-like protein